MTAVILARQAKADEKDLREPFHQEWGGSAEAILPLEPTPLEQLPSAYVRKAWENRERGSARDVSMRALVSADSLLLRLEWAAEQPNKAITDNDVYADACGVIFPLGGGEAELATMGSRDRPVRVWHWLAGAASPFSLIARGLGTTAREPATGLTVRAEWQAARWHVVFSRALDREAAPLCHGAALPIACAVWSGAAGERAGLKSYTPVWHRLQID